MILYHIHTHLIIMNTYIPNIDTHTPTTYMKTRTERNEKNVLFDPIISIEKKIGGGIFIYFYSYLICSAPFLVIIVSYLF